MHHDETEWGCPNWQDGDAYGSVDEWDAFRWRWEFKRRTQGLRFVFQDLANRDWRRWNPSVPIPLRLMWSDDYQHSVFYLTAELAAYHGFTAVPNPLYSDAIEELRRDNPTALGSLDGRTLTDWDISRNETKMFGRTDLLGAGQIAVVFDPNQAIEPQLEGLKEHLLKRKYHGIKPLERLHPKKFLRYLRILDAREQGASWSECASVLLTKNTAATPQTATDTYKQAQRIRDRL